MVRHDAVFAEQDVIDGSGGQFSKIQENATDAKTAVSVTKSEFIIRKLLEKGPGASDAAKQTFGRKMVAQAAEVAKEAGVSWETLLQPDLVEIIKGYLEQPEPEDEKEPKQKKDNKDKTDKKDKKEKKTLEKQSAGADSAKKKRKMTK